MKNLDIRMRIKENRLCHYEVAAQIGVSEYTLCRWLREELSAEKREGEVDVPCERILMKLEKLEYPWKYLLSDDTDGLSVDFD